MTEVTQGYISLLAYFGVLVISLPPRAIFHCLPSAIFYPFHCYPGLYFIACLLWCFTHFIATQAYISLLAWCNTLPISFLPRAIFHCLPTLVFYPFHCYPGLHFIACLVQCFSHFISTQGYISLHAQGLSNGSSGGWSYDQLPKMVKI